MGFQQGLSGLNAASKNLDVIGNNIANANTVRREGRRAPSSPTSTPTRSAAAATRSASARRSPPSPSSSRRATSRDRQPARRRHQRQRLLRGERSGRRGRVHAQRPVQGRQHRLHRQRPGPAADGLPGRRDRHDHPGHGDRAADADRRHHAGGDDARSTMEMNLDSRARRDAAGCGRADRLRRSDRPTTTRPRRPSTTPRARASR